MAFTPRTRAVIRDSLLADWSARYAALGLSLLTSEGSDAYMLAESLAVELDGLEYQAAALTKNIFPDTADPDSVVHHGIVDGVPQKSAGAAIMQVGVTGTSGASLTLTGKTMTAPGGQVYTVSANADGSGTSLTLSGATPGTGAVYLTAQLAGVAGNQATGTIFTWANGAPTGANPTATFASLTRPGTDTEAIEDYAARIIARRQNRPASGNRSDWRTWATTVQGVEEAYVYPLYHPTYGAGTPGSLTVVCLGPIATDGSGVQNGDSPINTRILSGAILAEVAGYVEGTNDASGAALIGGTQLRPVTLAAGDYAIEAPAVSAQDVELELTMAAAYAYPWTYNAGYTVAVGSTTTSVKVNGDVTAIVGTLPFLVHIGTSNVRGGYVMAQANATPTFGSGVTTLTLATALAATPTTGEILLPAPPNWAQIRLALFAYFDALGPGDSVSPSLRWPTEDMNGRATLYKSSLAASLIQELDSRGTLVAGVRGVLSANVVTPSSDTTPAAKTLVTLGRIRVHKP